MKKDQNRITRSNVDSKQEKRFTKQILNISNEKWKQLTTQQKKDLYIKLYKSSRKPVQIFFTHAEFETVKAAADRLNLKPGKYIKKRALDNFTESQMIPSVNRDTALNLMKMGNNINQIARMVNTFKDRTNQQMLLDKLSSIKEEIGNLIGELI